MDNRPDFSRYVVHFTNARQPVGTNDPSNPALEFTTMSAMEKLINILKTKIIKASTMPWTRKRATCFTECPWSSLLAHTQNYSPYGIGFDKGFLFSRHGGPALYVRTDHYADQQKLGWAEHIAPFITPFSPPYRPKSFSAQTGFDTTCDYTHEREWRVPHDLPFEYTNVKFIILNTYKDMAAFPGELKDAIGRERFVLMSNYRQIEALWPVHKH